MNFKSLDFFRKLPKDMDNSTVAGGIFSILAIIVIKKKKIDFFKSKFYHFFLKIGVLLFLSEF